MASAIGAVMESVYLRTLVEVVRSGSLSRAADALCVTQPAISRRVKFMEEQYGFELLDRSSNPVRLTNAGRMVYEKARAMLDIEEELQACLQHLGSRTRLCFSSTPAFGAAHMPGILREFMLGSSETSDLKFLFLSPPEILQGLQEGLFDAGVMEALDLLDLGAFATLPLPESETLFVSSPKLGISSPECPLEELLTHHLFTRREGCCSRILLERGLKTLGHGVDSFAKTVILDDFNMLLPMIEEGQGISFLPVEILHTSIQLGRITTHRVRDFPHQRARTLVVNQRNCKSPALPRLVAAILQHFKLGREAFRMPPEHSEVPI